MKNAISIGAEKQTVLAARQSIMDILKLPYIDSSLKAEALKAFVAVCQVNHTTVSGCSFDLK